MAQLTRNKMLTVALLAVTCAASAAALDSDELLERKHIALRQALVRQGQTPDTQALVATAGQAAALMGIHVQPSPAAMTVTLDATTPVLPKPVFLDGRCKLVIDLPNTIYLCDQPSILPADTSLLLRIRSSFFSLVPEPVSRVVLDLARPCACTAERGANGILLRLTPLAQPAASTVAAKTQDLCDELQTIREELQPGVPSPVEPALQPADELQEALCLVAHRAPKPTKAPERAIAHNLDLLASELEAVRATPADISPESPFLFAAVGDEESAQDEAPAEASTEEKPAEDQPAPPAKREGSDSSAPYTVAPVFQRMKSVISSLSQQEPEGEEQPQVEEAQPAQEAEAAKPNPKAMAQVQEAAQPAPEGSAPPAAQPQVQPPVFQGDPFQQIVNIDFREMELANIVALLAQKAQVNVIAGTELTGLVTANLRNVTLRQAMETALRMNGLGLLEEEGIYRIVPYDEAQLAQRETVTLKLENAQASAVKTTLEDVIKGAPGDTLTAISADDNTNMLIIAGPENRVAELFELAQELDISKPVIPTVTEAIKINNADPAELVELTKSMLSADIGQVAMDTRSRYLVVTDAPVVVEQVRALIQELDQPVKQVSIDAMIVDAVLGDSAETGVDWVFNSVRKTNRRGEIIGSLQDLGFETDSTGLDVTPGSLTQIPLASQLTMGVLTSNIDIKAAIAGEVHNENARLLANPVVVTVENKKATVNITSEIPYEEFTQSLTGPPVASTEFKDVGVVLEVTPRVTHDDHIIAELSAKQSDTKGEINGIPVEDKRETETTLRTKNGQTIFIAGLRRFDDEVSTRRVPVLGSLPVVNGLFRNNIVTKENTELLVFLTCNVLPDEIGQLELTPEQAEGYHELDSIPRVPNAQKTLGRSLLRPNEVYDPAMKWRRSN